MHASQAEKPSSMAVSDIRDRWNTHKLDNNDSDIEQDAEDISRRHLSTDLSQTLRTRQLLLDFDGDRPILSLRAPADLVNFPSIFRPRWPVECEVISDVIDHIEWDPPEPEPFYQITGCESTPLPARKEKGKVVYFNDHAIKNPYYTSSHFGGSRGPIKCATCYISESELILEFESRFESGNLQKAVQVGLYDYDLTLSTDMYTDKHTQWFYFRVRNMKAGETYCFTIVNLMKSNSLYSLGMRPLLYSEKAAKEEGVGWQRIGSNIRYYRNGNQEKNGGTPTLYSLTWNFQFPYDSDTCYLAHCYPYTYSRLQNYLRCISTDPIMASYCNLRVLCRSLAGNDVYVLTITARGSSECEDRMKKTVVVTARVHPGETNGSWMMEGFLDYLLGESEDARLLRETFVFKVVPMLNPDGVVVGNYRCSLAGRDLNRNYKTVLRKSFPCVWYTRNMVERLMTTTGVGLYCDFHGHNRKNNVFMYGCKNHGEPALKLRERIFPLMFSKNASNKFSFKSCRFQVQKNKEGTGRIAMWSLGIKNSYTMEASFGGSTLGDRRGTHFTTRDLKSFGFHFCDTLLDFYDPDPSKINYCLTELAALQKDLGISDMETSTSGSNSSDSDGLPAHLLHQPKTGLSGQTSAKKKKRRLKSRKERNRLRPDRVLNAEPKTQESSKLNIEFSLLAENIVKGKQMERDRKRYQMNNLRKVEIPPATSTPGGISQVTLWEGSEPPKDDFLEDIRLTCPYHGTRPCPDLSSCIATSPQTEDQRNDLGSCRCASQLLHLSANPRQLFTTYKVYRGPTSVTIPHRCTTCTLKAFPNTGPTMHVLSNISPDKLNSQHVFKDRNVLQTSQFCFTPEDAVVNENAKKAVNLPSMSLLTCIPIRERRQRNRNFIPVEEEADGPLFVPVSKGTNGQRQLKETMEDKRHNLPHVRKSSVLGRFIHPRPQTDIFHKLQISSKTNGIKYSSAKEQ